jgi:hypothetical protein
MAAAKGWLGGIEKISPFAILQKHLYKRGMIAPFSFQTIDLSTIEHLPADISFTLTAAERQQVSGAWQDAVLEECSGHFTITARDATSWRIDGHVQAVVQQPCRYTLEPVHTKLDEPISLIATPIDLPDEDEDVEVVEEGMLYLGDIAMQYMLLALPEYPQQEGVDFSQILAQHGLSQDDGAPANQFAKILKP